MKTLTALVLVGAASTSIAYAEPPADVTVDQALELYRQRNARLAAERAQVDVTAADTVEANIYPNPEAGLSTMRTTVGDTAGPLMQYQLDLGIPILIGHQRGKRMQAALAHVAQTKREVDADQAEAELAIRDTFETLLAAQEKTTVLDAALADEKKIREIVAGRSSAGAGSSYAVERMDLAIAEVASRAAEAHADETAASLTLAVSVGIPGWQPHATGTLDDATAETAVDSAHPLLAELRAQFSSARADEVRAHADAVPTPSLNFSAYTTTTPEGLGLVGGFSIPLPLFDKNQGAVARARAEAHRADLELAATTIELSGALQAATHDLSVRKDALTHFQADALQRVAKIREMAEVSYKSGQGSIVELLDALDAITEARLRELELRLNVAQASLAVRRASRGR